MAPAYIRRFRGRKLTPPSIGSKPMAIVRFLKIVGIRPKVNSLENPTPLAILEYLRGSVSKTAYLLTWRMLKGFTTAAKTEPKIRFF